jgi:SNF2 family DNA or RNA helicase
LAYQLPIENSGGELSNSKTDLLPHQILLTHQIISARRRKFLIADEVGLGKTIEVGMIIKELLSRGEAKRILVICPAGLTARKFDVSTEALLLRLLNLKLLNKNTVDNILKDQLFREIDKSTMAPRWWRPPEFPERFVRLAFVAYKKGRLSKAKLAEMLDTSLIDLPKTLQEYGHKDREGYDAEVRVA